MRVGSWANTLSAKLLSGQTSGTMPMSVKRETSAGSSMHRTPWPMRLISQLDHEACPVFLSYSQRPPLATVDVQPQSCLCSHGKSTRPFLQRPCIFGASHLEAGYIFVGMFVNKFSSFQALFNAIMANHDTRASMSCGLHVRVDGSLWRFKFVL